LQAHRHRDIDSGREKLFGSKIGCWQAGQQLEATKRFLVDP